MDDLLTMIGMEPPSTAADGEGALSVTAPEQPAPASPIPPTELTLMPAASSSAPMAQASGEHFMMWLKQGITSRSEEHTSELQSLMRISYAVFCLKKKKQK